MKQLQPIIIVDLFAEILEELINLLSSLSTEDWDKPTACASWSVKDVALHLLGDDIGMLSRKRDGHSSAASIESWDELVALINDWNEMWVQAGRRMSSRLLIDLLRFTGAQVCEYFRSLAPYSIGGPVSWATLILHRSGSILLVSIRSDGITSSISETLLTNLV